MKLTIRKCELTGAGWYIIERAVPRWTVENGERFSDADVEGRGAEMLAIADAIKNRGHVAFRRCAVNVVNERVFFWSPRNSSHYGECNLSEADELAELILNTVPPR
jgi:hypothetical protein